MTQLSCSKLLGKVAASKEFSIRSNDLNGDLEVQRNLFFGLEPIALCLKLTLLGYDMAKIFKI